MLCFSNWFFFMQEIILHIGHGKTGTSYLQSCLALNRQKLLDIGIDYPEDLSFKNAKKGRITSGNPSQFFKNHLNIESLTDKEIILFSNEGFYETLNHLRSETKLKSFNHLKFFKKYSNKLKVILYTRNLFSHFFSIWAQQVKRSSLVSGIDTFLKNRPSSDCFLISDWLNLQKKFGFKLIIKNYSYHKSNLLNVFLEDVAGEKAKNMNFTLPENRVVNRSLTFSEYEIQRICNFLNMSEKPLSDFLVNQLPNIKPMEIRCSLESYNIVKDANIEIINRINNQINKNESIKIESPEEVVYKENQLQNPPLTEDQIKIIASYIDRNI